MTKLDQNVTTILISFSGVLYGLEFLIVSILGFAISTFHDGIHDIQYISKSNHDNLYAKSNQEISRYTATNSALS